MWKRESSGDRFLEKLEELVEEAPQDYEKILDLVFNELAPRAIKGYDDTRKMTPEEIAESLED